VPTATPDTLVQTLVQFVTAAAAEAAAPIAHALDRAQQNPADVLDQLRDSLGRPDSFSLLVFVLVGLAELDRDHLSVGALPATDGWSRAVALTYRERDDADAPSATVALALTDPGTAHGVIFRIDGLEQARVARGRVSLSITGQGNGEWRVPFTGGVRAPQTTATMRCSLEYGPVHALAPGTPVGVGLGTAHVSVALSNDAPVWRVEVAMGDAHDVPGLEARADFADALGPVAGVLQIARIGEQYSPALIAAAGAVPAFTLGHEG
jgi:hypothetical protein